MFGCLDWMLYGSNWEGGAGSNLYEAHHSSFSYSVCYLLSLRLIAFIYYIYADIEYLYVLPPIALMC